MPLGYALTGPIVAAAGTRATMIGVAGAAFVLSLMFVLNRDLRELRIDGPVAVPKIGVPGV
jgi:hypothetical protein